MSKPVSHHYLPQFLMNPWRDPDTKKASVYWKPHDCVVVTQRSPKSIGCEDHLYTLHSPQISDRSAVETEIMTKSIDTPAAAVHRKPLYGRDTEFLNRVYSPIGPQTLLVAGTKRFFETEVRLRPEFLQILPLQFITDQMALAKGLVIAESGPPP